MKQTIKTLAIALFFATALMVPVVHTEYASFDVATVYALGGNSGGDVGSGGSSGGSCCGGGGSTPTTPTPPTPPRDPDPIVPSCQLTADLAVINAGGNSTLTWTAVNAVSASINQGIGNVSVPTGSRVVSPSNTITYTMTVVSSTGTSRTCAATVTVNPVVVPAPACVSFTATPKVFNNGTGGSFTLAWDTTNVSSVTIDNGVGTFNGPDGSTQTSWTVSPVSSSVSKTYTLTALGTNGTSKTCTETVTINPTTVTPETPRCDFFDTNASKVRSGATVTLSWGTTNVTDVTIDNGIGNVSVDGSRDVVINNNTTFTLTARNAQGQTVTCNRSIAIETGGGGGGGSSSPRCELDISKTKVSKGQEVTLSWETSRGNEITIYEGTVKSGKKIFDSNDDDVVDEGSIKVRPTKDTTYTLLVERGSKDKTCTVKVSTGDDVIVISTRDQGKVAGIALTHVPYTGFEAGPALTILFYLLLTLWGLFAAYSLTIKKDSILGFSLAGAFPRNKVVTDASTEAVMNTEEVSKAEAYVATATAPANLPTGNAPIIGYAQALAEDEELTEEKTALNEQFTDLENRAHSKHVLLSSDAMRFFAARYTTEEQFDALDTVMAEAKAAYPTEDGWVVLNLERMQALADATVATSAAVAGATPTGAGSLAEAIVTGNIVAAYSMIGHRPMIALADAAADLDAVYRLRQGSDATVSDLLVASTTHLTELQLTTAIAALSGALDGIYTTEQEAVKMAIMKAVKSIHN